MSTLESLIADCHRRGYRVGDLAELRDGSGWRARLWTRDDKETDFSTGRTASVALGNALNEITGGPGSEKARTPKRTKKPTPPPTQQPDDMEDLLT